MPAAPCNRIYRFTDALLLLFSGHQSSRITPGKDQSHLQVTGNRVRRQRRFDLQSIALLVFFFLMGFLAFKFFQLMGPGI